MKQSKRIT